MFLGKLNTQSDENQVEEFLRKEILNETKPCAAVSKLCGGIRPSRVRVTINDKLAKTIFKLSDEATEDILGGQIYKIVEKRDKKLGDVTTAYRILNEAGYQVLRPFNMFDRFVLDVCISEWLAGNRYTTIAMIYRGLTGKIGRSDSQPSVAQRKAIIESLEILMSRTVDYRAEGLCLVMKYNKGNMFYRKGSLLPAAYVDFTELGGDADTVIFFTNVPPLLLMSEIKKQIISYDATLLDMPGQNTTMSIAAKNYTMLRIQEIKLHHQLVPTITFGDVYQKLCIENADNKTKLRVREFIVAFFEHLKGEGVIKSFEVVKHGNSFYGIKFPRPKKS